MKLNEIKWTALSRKAEKALDDILVGETGGDYKNDKELLKNVIKAVRASRDQELMKLSDKEIGAALKSYIKDMESSGDWD